MMRRSFSNYSHVRDRQLYTGTYFSLSTKEGVIAGSNRTAQSFSSNISAVAPNASNAAFRACTNGSLRALVNAAVKTF